MDEIKKITEKWVKENLCDKCKDPYKTNEKCALCGVCLMAYDCFYNGCLEMQKRLKLVSQKNIEVTTEKNITPNQEEEEVTININVKIL